MFNWYDGERQVQQHKNAARDAGERYAHEQLPGDQRHRSVLRRVSDFAGRTLSAWGQRSEKRTAEEQRIEPSYNGRQSR